MQNDIENPSPQDAEESSGLMDKLFSQWFVSSFLVGLVWIGVNVYESHEKAVEKQIQAKQREDGLREKVRRGETGEAFKRLYPEDHNVFLESQRRQNENPPEDDLP